jgi:hypothetical protein
VASIGDIRVKVAIAIVEADGIESPMVATRSQLVEAGKTGLPGEVQVVVFCPFGMGAEVQRRLHELSAERLLEEMEPHGRIS